MSEIKVGQFYVYRDEDGNAVAIAVMSEGSNGGRMGVDCARMPVPYGKTTRESINNRAEFMVAALNSYDENRAAPIIEIQNRLVAKQISERIFLRTLAVAALAAIALSFFFVGLPEMQRWEKANQENVSHVARR